MWFAIQRDKQTISGRTLYVTLPGHRNRVSRFEREIKRTRVHLGVGPRLPLTLIHVVAIKVNPTQHRSKSSKGHFMHFQHTVRLGGLYSSVYPQINAWKSSFCPVRPSVHWALPIRDCASAGNFFGFCFVHTDRRITSSETHLTRLPLPCCPQMNPNSRFHLPANGKCSRAGILNPYYAGVCSLYETQRAQGHAERVNLTSRISLMGFVADRNPYRLIFKVLHVLNLHIYCADWTSALL